MNKERVLDDVGRLWLVETTHVRDCVWTGALIQEGEYAVALDHGMCSAPPVVIHLDAVSDTQETLRQFDADEVTNQFSHPAPAMTIIYHKFPSTSRRLGDDDECINCGKSIGQRRGALQIPCMCPDGAIWLHTDCCEAFADALDRVWEQTDLLLGSRI